MSCRRGRRPARSDPRPLLVTRQCRAEDSPAPKPPMRRACRLAPFFPDIAGRPVRRIWWWRVPPAPRRYRSCSRGRPSVLVPLGGRRPSERQCARARRSRCRLGLSAAGLHAGRADRAADGFVQRAGTPASAAPPLPPSPPAGGARPADQVLRSRVARQWGRLMRAPLNIGQSFRRHRQHGIGVAEICAVLGYPVQGSDLKQRQRRALRGPASRSRSGMTPSISAMRRPVVGPPRCDN